MGPRIRTGLAHLVSKPSSGCIPHYDDEEERDAFPHDDMKIIRVNLHKLDSNDQLLVRILATTGVRRGEAFEIDNEETENGIRFVTIGTKTAASPRRVPFPKDLLPHLPKKISGQLITGRMDTADKQIRSGCMKSASPTWTRCRCTAFVTARPSGCVRPVSRRMCAKRSADGPTARRKPAANMATKNGAGYPLKLLKKAIDIIGM